jgi:hypothetical protein
MDDVLEDRVKFGMNREDLVPGVRLFDEDEIYDLLEKIKESSKTLKDPDYLNYVYKVSFDTLQELMCSMN